MRKALTLVELVFTIVIIALVFTVIPKVVFSLSKSDQFSIRQDALFAGVSLMNTISRLPWDEQNNLEEDILQTDSANFTCNASSGLRVGGFTGSRSCDNNLSALSLSNDGQSDYTLYNDVDDFVAQVIEAKTFGGDTLYELNTTVQFLDDSLVYDTSNRYVSVDLSSLPSSANTSNLKKVDIIVSYAGNRGEKRQLSQFSFTSSNIGLMRLNSRSW